MASILTGIKSDPIEIDGETNHGIVQFKGLSTDTAKLDSQYQKLVQAGKRNGKKVTRRGNLIFGMPKAQEKTLVVKLNSVHPIVGRGRKADPKADELMDF